MKIVTNILDRIQMWLEHCYVIKMRASEKLGSDYHMSFDVLKFNSMEERWAGSPYAEFHGKKNILTPAGRQIMWKLFSGQGAATDFYSTINSYIFIGDSSLASPTTSGQPFDLLGANVTGVVVDSTAPTITVGADGQTVTIQYTATFDVNTANYTWAEAGLCNASAVGGAPDLTTLPGSGTLFNRYVSPTGAIGIKTSGLVWVAQMNLILGPTGD